MGARILSERRKVYTFAYRDQTAANDDAGDAVRGRNREAQEGGKNYRQRRPEGYREKKLFRTNECLGHQAFAGKLLEQRLREKNRSDRTGKRCNRRPGNRGAVTRRTTAKERGDAFEVVVGAV